MRFASLIIATSFACAAPSAVSDMRAELDELKEKQQVDKEDLNKKLSFEV
jgi:hypothetical protein